MPHFLTLQIVQPAPMEEERRRQDLRSSSQKKESLASPCRSRKERRRGDRFPGSFFWSDLPGRAPVLRKPSPLLLLLPLYRGAFGQALAQVRWMALERSSARTYQGVRMHLLEPGEDRRGGEEVQPGGHSPARARSPAPGGNALSDLWPGLGRSPALDAGEGGAGDQAARAAWLLDA